MLSPILKAVEKLILPSLTEAVWSTIGDYQAGFRPGHTCHNNIIKLMEWQLHRKRVEKGPYYVFFFDIAKAYDSGQD